MCCKESGRKEIKREGYSVGRTPLDIGIDLGAMLAEYH